MKIPSAALILALSLPAGAAVAAAPPDHCAARKQALRTDAEKACSGLSYLFNPSGCFIARKALEAFDADQCRGAAAPEQALPVPSRANRADTPPQTVPADVPPPLSGMQEASPHGAAVPEPDLAQVKSENARLRAEIERLMAEIERLKEGKGGAGGTR